MEQEVVVFVAQALMPVWLSKARKRMRSQEWLRH